MNSYTYCILLRGFTMLKTKVLIVGAGPAGTSCAIRLQQLKQKCILIDNQVFPRNKLCGGAWTQKTSRVFKEIIMIIFAKSLVLI